MGTQAKYLSLSNFQCENGVRMTEKPIITPTKLVEKNLSVESDNLFTSLFTKAGKLRKRRASGKHVKTEPLNTKLLQKTKSPPKQSTSKRKLESCTPKRKYNRKIKKENTADENMDIAKVNESMQLLTEYPLVDHISVGSSNITYQLIAPEID